MRWCFLLLCCRGTTRSTEVPSQLLSTQNIKNSDSANGNRSSFQSGSLLCDTMKQHPSPELLPAVGPTCSAGWKRMLMSDLLSFDLNVLFWTVSLHLFPSRPCIHCTHTNANSTPPHYCFFYKVGCACGIIQNWRRCNSFLYFSISTYVECNILWTLHKGNLIFMLMLGPSMLLRSQKARDSEVNTLHYALWCQWNTGL